MPVLAPQGPESAIEGGYAAGAVLQGLCCKGYAARAMLQGMCCAQDGRRTRRQPSKLELPLQITSHIIRKSILFLFLFRILFITLFLTLTLVFTLTIIPTLTLSAHFPQ